MHSVNKLLRSTVKYWEYKFQLQKFHALEKLKALLSITSAAQDFEKGKTCLKA